MSKIEIILKLNDYIFENVCFKHFFRVFENLHVSVITYYSFK